MKAENKTTVNNRTIRLTELPGTDDTLTELVIVVNYQGESNCLKGVTIDSIVIPAILKALNNPHQ